MLPCRFPLGAFWQASLEATPHLLQPPEQQQEEMAATGPGTNLPPCKAHRAAEVAQLVTSALSSASRREEIFRLLEVSGF